MASYVLLWEAAQRLSLALCFLSCCLAFAVKLFFLSIHLVVVALFFLHDAVLIWPTNRLRMQSDHTAASLVVFFFTYMLWEFQMVLIQFHKKKFHNLSCCCCCCYYRCPAFFQFLIHCLGFGCRFLFRFTDPSSHIYLYVCIARIGLRKMCFGHMKFTKKKMNWRRANQFRWTDELKKKKKFNWKSEIQTLGEIIKHNISL